MSSNCFHGRKRCRNATTRKRHPKIERVCFYLPSAKDGIIFRQVLAMEHLRYICPNNQVLSYRTTNRDGYHEYKSSGTVCENCPYLAQCTQSRNHVKVVTRHIWEPYLEMCEDIRHTLGMKELYPLRKETIERVFASTKENHRFRYTQMFGKARMEMKTGLTFTLKTFYLLDNLVHGAVRGRRLDTASSIGSKRLLLPKGYRQKFRRLPYLSLQTQSLS